MPSKYDTNPLDPDFPEKARAAAAGEETRTLPYRGGETRQFPPDETARATAPTDEQQTRRFSEPDVSAYSASTYAPPFTGQYVPIQYPQGFGLQDARKRKVASIGLSEHLVIAACYFPFYIGLVAGLILLLLTPKSEPKVRFHAAQGLGAHLGILAVATLLGIVTGLAGGDLGTFIFKIAAFVTLVIFTIKAFKGSPIYITPLEDLTNWLEEKLGPVK
jgi:uncharacterized membrane protein